MTDRRFHPTPSEYGKGKKYLENHLSPSSSSSGTIRLFNKEGENSSLVQISIDTRSEQLAEQFKVDDIYIQMGNLHIKRLPSDSRPLFLIRDLLSNLGYSIQEMESAATNADTRHIIAFFAGRPQLQPNSSIRSEFLIADCSVRRGKIVHRWSDHRCILYNATIHIQREGNQDEVLPLHRYKASLYDCRKGKCLRLSSLGGSIIFYFKDSNSLTLWLSRCQQNEYRWSCDLSDQRLTLLPENLFNIAEEGGIKHLNLRRNSLSVRIVNKENIPLIGWLDDLTRLQSLTSLDLSFNKLSSFPLPITQLTQLERLNLSSNDISIIPVNIKLIRSLIHLDLSNNWISSLPDQISECTRIISLNLSFNRFTQIPDCLHLFSSLTEWKLSGNRIERVDCHPAALLNIFILDLRRNNLTNSFRLPNTTYEQLTHIDIRDNCNVSTIHLTNVPSLQIFHCERLQLSSLHLNGHNLTHLYASHNLLDSMVIMPIPLKLTHLDLSFNQFESLPDWICDLPYITYIKANNNKISLLPDRIFCTPSLRFLLLFNNQILHLPESIWDCNIETLIMYNNNLQHLPSDLFKLSHRLRHLNVSFNHLTSLPSVPSNIDSFKIQTLRLAQNDVDESILPIIVAMKRLKILDLSANKMRYFDDSALSSLTSLEELNISGNELSQLSSTLPSLPAIHTIRAHSNHLTSLPSLAQSLTLQVVDFSNNSMNNQLEDLFSIGPSLKQLDITCNYGLNLNTGTLRRRNGRKSVSLTDIGLDSQSDNLHIGFAESTGNRNRLCVRRFRSGNVFGLIDGGSNYELPKKIITHLNILTSNIKSDEIDLRKTILSCHSHLGEMGERLGSSIILLNVTSSYIDMMSVGNIGCAIVVGGNIEKITTNQEIDEEEFKRIRAGGGIVDENNLINGICSCNSQLGQYSLYPIIRPRPNIRRIEYNENIEWIVIATKSLWDLLSLKVINNILRSTYNPHVAAKQLQDALHACDFNANSSILVLRFAKPEVNFISPINREEKPSIPSMKRESDRIFIPPLRISNNKDEISLEKMENRLEKISHEISTIKNEENLKYHNNNDETDEGFISGRQLYDRILADEMSHSPPLHRSTSTVPPNSSLSNDSYYSSSNINPSLYIKSSISQNIRESTERNHYQNMDIMKEKEDLPSSPPPIPISKLPTSPIPYTRTITSPMLISNTSSPSSIQPRITKYRFESTKTHIEDKLKLGLSKPLTYDF